MKRLQIADENLKKCYVKFPHRYKIYNIRLQQTDRHTDRQTDISRLIARQQSTRNVLLAKKPGDNDVTRPSFKIGLPACNSAHRQAYTVAQNKPRVTVTSDYIIQETHQEMR